MPHQLRGQLLGLSSREPSALSITTSGLYLRAWKNSPAQMRPLQGTISSATHLMLTLKSCKRACTCSSRCFQQSTIHTGSTHSQPAPNSEPGLAATPSLMSFTPNKCRSSSCKPKWCQFIQMPKFPQKPQSSNWTSPGRIWLFRKAESGSFLNFPTTHVCQFMQLKWTCQKPGSIKGSKIPQPPGHSGHPYLQPGFNFLVDFNFS